MSIAIATAIRLRRTAADIRSSRGYGATGVCRAAVRLVIVLVFGLGLATVAEAQAPPETVEYYATDALGSVRVVFSATGEVIGRSDYLPFGETLNQSGKLPKQRFTGQERDGEAGLDYFNARSLQARTGRMNRPDPLFSGAMTDPQGWNRYSYVGNSPLTFTDPSGMSADPELGQDQKPPPQDQHPYYYLFQSGVVAFPSRPMVGGPVWLTIGPTYWPIIGGGGTSGSGYAGGNGRDGTPAPGPGPSPSPGPAPGPTPNPTPAPAPDGAGSVGSQVAAVVTKVKNAVTKNLQCASARSNGLSLGAGLVALGANPDGLLLNTFLTNDAATIATIFVGPGNEAAFGYAYAGQVGQIVARAVGHMQNPGVTGLAALGTATIRETPGGTAYATSWQHASIGNSMLGRAIGLASAIKGAWDVGTFGGSIVSCIADR